MGLGKTLSMIALVASDQDCEARNTPQINHGANADELHSTLVVVPLNCEDNHISLSCPNTNPIA